MDGMEDVSWRLHRQRHRRSLLRSRGRTRLARSRADMLLLLRRRRRAGISLVDRRERLVGNSLVGQAGLDRIARLWRLRRLRLVQRLCSLDRRLIGRRSVALLLESGNRARVLLGDALLVHELCHLLGRHGPAASGVVLLLLEGTSLLLTQCNLCAIAGIATSNGGRS